MRKYIVSLLAFPLFLAIQTHDAVAGHRGSVAFVSRGFVARPIHHRFVSSSVIVVNPFPARFVRTSPFARQIVVFPRRAVLQNAFIADPFACSGVIVQLGSEIFCAP